MNLITREMLAKYDDLSRRKKEIDQQLDQLKKIFNEYLDTAVGEKKKADMMISDYKLQRQIRLTEKYEQEATVAVLEKLNLADLIVKRPDEGKIKAALDLGLLKEEDLEGCKKISTSQAIFVKQIVTN